jgi:NAD(P)-dependent dehydrogenase (short-subunit alcohol dehydrogenase family)
MDEATIDGIFKSLLYTNVTKSIHRDTYPAISPTLASLSQVGRTVLITGGGTGVGFAIATSFIRAGATTVIIIGRRSNILASAAAKLEAVAKETGSGTQVIAQSCDVVNLAEVEKFWAGLAHRGITVDVYIANAAKFTEPKPILELGADEVWSQMEMNVKSPLYFVEKFNAQPGDGQRVRPDFLNFISLFLSAL